MLLQNRKKRRRKNIIIAFLDIGCQTGHVDLKGRIIGGKNFTTDNNSDPKNYSDMNETGVGLLQH